MHKWYTIAAAYNNLNAQIIYILCLNLFFKWVLLCIKKKKKKKKQLTEGKERR
jgi:hypothetical protein